MSGDVLQRARLQSGLTQVEAARKLGVSQTLLSLMEKGKRSVTFAVAVRAVELLHASPVDLPLSDRRHSSDNQLAGELGALGYPGFSHLYGALRNPAEVLFDALNRTDLDARVVEALPWLPLHFPKMNWTWLTAQARLHNRQNRLGFVIELAVRAALRKNQHELAKDLYRSGSALRESRLVRNDTLCQESWPPSQRLYAHLKRSKPAMYWKLDTRLTEKDLAYVSA